MNTVQEKKTEQPKIKVMIVDDSAVIRAVMTGALRAEKDIEIVGTATNGDLAVKSVAALNPDVLILDIEMPVMDGITALPLLLKANPGMKVLMCSTLSAKGAEISIRALSLGAADCLLKPGGDAIVTADDFKDTLLRIIRQLGVKTQKSAPGSPSSISGAANKPKITLRTEPLLIPPKILAIGSSTGGPQVLLDLLAKIKNAPVPIVITQHMPPTFTTMLAGHISRACNLTCVEGKEGDVLKPGQAYIAPGGLHMIFQKQGENVTIHLDNGPPENFCKPAVDPMLRSLVSIYGGRILTVILTGMGHDGAKGCTEVVKQGGHVIAQDEASSVVWGMPGTAAAAGVCSALLPPSGLAAWIEKALHGGKP